MDDLFALKVHLNLDGFAADLAILKELLPPAAAWIETGAQFLTAVRTLERIILFDHENYLETSAPISVSVKARSVWDFRFPSDPTLIMSDAAVSSSGASIVTTTS